MQSLQITLTLEATRRLEQISQKQGKKAEELAAILLEQSILKKGYDNTIRLVHKENRDNDYNDPQGLMEIIRRQDEEINWLRAEVTRLNSVHSPIHIIHHREDGSICPQVKLSVEKSDHAKNDSRTLSSDNSPSSEKPENAPPGLTDDFSGVNLSHIIDSSAYRHDLLTPSSGSQISGSQQVSGKTLRDLVGGITGDKNYTVFEAAAIAGETESVILEYINDGFLPAIKDSDNYLIRGNDLRQYILSK